MAPMEDLIALLAGHALAVVFLVTLVARVGAPLPAAPLLVVAGGLAAGRGGQWAGLLAVAVAANVLGDGVWFWAGRRWGQRVLGLLCRVSLSPDSCVRQSESLVLRWGAGALIAAKFVPGVSVVAAPMAGALGMSRRRFVAYDALGGALWAGLFLGLGSAFHDMLEEVLLAMADAGLAAALLLVVAIGLFVAWRWWRRRRARRARATPRITVGELQALIACGAAPVILDVRSAAAAGLGGPRIPGAMPVDLAAIEAHGQALPREREIVLYCNCPNEASAALAATRLLAVGFTRARPLAGGIDAWIAAGHPVDETDATAAGEVAAPAV